MTRLKSLLFILIFVLLYAAYYWVVPLAVDIQGRVGLIKSIVKKEFGTEIELKNPRLKMGLTPSIWLDASYFSILDKNSEPFLIKNPKLKIRLLPLFFGKVHLAYFSCDKIEAKLKLDKNYRLYIGNYLFIKTSDPKVSIEDSKMDVESYEISLKDEVQNKNILLNGDYFDLEKYNSKKYIKFSTISRLKVNERSSTINADVDFKLPLAKGFDTNEIVFDGTITNLNLADFSPYIKALSKNKIKQTSGILNIEADTKILNRKTTQIASQMAVENFSIVGEDKASSLYFKNKLNIEVVFDASKNKLNIEKFKIMSKSINADITGKINKISSKNPVLDLSILINKSRIEDFIALIPAVNSSDVDMNLVALKKYGYYSDIEGKLLIKGKSDKPKLTGEFISTNGYVIKPPPSDTPKTTVKLTFSGEKLYMDITVPTNKNEKVIIKGTVDLYGEKNSDLDITSTASVDLEATESILNPMHEIFNFEIGPVPVMKLQGVGNIKLKVGGNKKNSHLFGAFNFKNTTASFNGINMQLKNGEGSLYFQDTDTHFITRTASLDGKPIKIDGKCSLFGVLDYDVTANGQDLGVLINVLKTSPMLADIQKSIPPIKKAEGKLNLALKLSGKVKNLNDFNLGKTVMASGTAKLLGDNVLLEGLQISIKNLFGNIKFKNNNADFDLYSFVDKSKVKIKGKIKNGIFNLKVKLDDVAFSYSNIPVRIFSGNLELNNNKITLYKVNAELDSMPVLVDGMITDIFKNPNFNLYVNSKPTQKFIEKYINKNTTYPLKIKGDIIYSSRIHGMKDSFNAKTEVNLQEGSNIYYMGSTLGDANDPIRVFLDSNVSKNTVYVNNFQYDKLITSQNNKDFISPQLNAKGQINIDKNDINLHNFRVKTQNPTDAKIFNILFKKPMIKQGLFSSNVVINGSIASPKLLGFLNFTGIDIPLLDTTIKDVSLDFGDKNIDVKTKGEIFSNKVILFSNMENRLTPPYVLNDVDIYLGNLDINQIAKSLNKLEIESDMNKLSEQKQNNSGFNITNLVIKNAKLRADSVFVKNLFAKNLTAEFSLNEKLLFSLDNFKFDVAEGTVNGNFKYNLLNSNSALELHVDKVNANSMAEALFDLPNQIFGSLMGEAELTCNGKTHKTCMDTLSGKGGFRVVDGKMPKLGSLEYLLKAANLVKSGVTGITINSIIELVSPLKTGQFENINGNFSIKSGLADSIQIFSRGKDLSLFLTGTYNFATLVADMEVYGRISKKISNVLGPVGNVSLNTLFNTIPGLNLDETNKTDFVKNLNKVPGFELNDKTYRIFSAEIYGDINGENYVQSFKWVE
ncbi:MAG: AsmA-like C-terminal region-containing protein [Candidatus Gastranaerophilaceae bacterium]